MPTLQPAADLSTIAHSKRDMFPTPAIGSFERVCRLEIPTPAKRFASTPECNRKISRGRMQDAADNNIGAILRRGITGVAETAGQAGKRGTWESPVLAIRGALAVIGSPVRPHAALSGRSGKYLFLIGSPGGKRGRLQRGWETAHLHHQANISNVTASSTARVASSVRVLVSIDEPAGGIHPDLDAGVEYLAGGKVNSWGRDLLWYRAFMMRGDQGVSSRPTYTPSHEDRSR
ncbi:hypothetical protein B0T11DRAFT_318451 [Plectosphaerella cucumerina]|uniref:Uncharacterized protein n=1 Tax=Plectosphaerella cucumerina TaxID=40658 RepID=A0A8K0X4X2_9PEZI|nr:hypothetical protein B0T11DRAFT_318451 [Plectosphaerella cucumerina]